MLRSMLSDYGSLDEATCAKLASVKGCYYSNHTLDGYSRNYGAVYDNLDYAEASETDAIFPDEYLRWYYVRKSLDVAYGLLDSINKSITNRVNE